ncbi:hypothetical protein MRB53_031863 [Persea americana]|uniref:Uncharacterized protein n=1 Tax=Persea americana TaxID=3435 RepID=A0ACC2KQ78_PERAE|nr:hypothetical protein MRB53_031863 [Persea americana]
MDSLCFKPGGSHGISAPHVAVPGGLDLRTHPAQVSALGRGTGVPATSNGIAVESPATAKSSFTAPLRSLWPATGERRNDGNAPEDSVVDGGEREGEEEEVEGEEFEVPPRSEKRRGNWVLKILHITSLWSDRRRRSEEEGQREEQEDDVVVSDPSRCSCCDEDDSDLCRVGEGKEEKFDKESFSRLLRRVSLVEAKVYAQMSYLGSLAYSIPKIKPRNLLKHQGLRFVTSSLEKKAQLAAAEKEQMPALEKAQSDASSEKEQLSSLETVKETEGDKLMNNGYRISASTAYQIAAAAASYLQSHTKSILSFRSAKTSMKEDLVEGGDHSMGDGKIASSEMASFVATTNSVTAVVAGKEEMKQAVAKDLSSARSSPCEWFICDDDNCGTRFFVIQGSESMASWQANLLFEPIQFEGLNILVHRGIYEAAKGIYEQILPEVRGHLKSRGNSATFRFTGHSLGGSLSLLVNLMLLIRGEVPLSSLLPVITFGSPSIMCGGDRLLRDLGLPQSHVQAIVMHRDIVPRAFSCNYPDHVAELLKALNGNFRNHPCLNNQKLLYAPMGKLLILQPEEKFSPHHHLLPSGSGLYLLGHPPSDSDDLVKQIRAAQNVFLNSPHPLEILSDRSAYGSDGAICRDHDLNSYMRSVRAVIRQELKHIRKLKREQRRKAWWPLVARQGIHGTIIVGQHAETAMGLRQLTFSSIFQSGRESLKRFSRLVASQHVRMLVVLLFPARLLLTVISFH